MNSLRARVLALVAGAGLVMALVLALVMHTSVRSYYLDVVYKQANEFIDRVIAQYPGLWYDYETDKQGFSERLRQYVLFAPDTGMYLLDPQGRVLASSGEGKLFWSNYRVDLGPIRASLANDPNMPLMGEDPDTRRDNVCVVAARPLIVDGEEKAWLYVVVRSADLAMQMPEQLKSYAIKTAVKVALLTLAIGVALTVAMIALLTRPLTALTAVAERVKNSGFSEPACTTVFPFCERNDEVGRLSRTFNDTLERLKQEMQRVTQTDVRRREMVASVSHDLRTPLTALIGQLETIRMKAGSLSETERQRFFDAAYNNANQLKRLTDALAELAKLDNPEVEIDCEPIALGELADDLVQRYGLRCEEAGIRLRVVYPDGLPLVCVDAALIERALSNLLDNAIRVTPAGGEIEVRVTRDGTQLKLEVADTGPGVADADRERVFDRFYQGSAHREHRGSSGLGLAIVKRVAELHGGSAGLADGTRRGAAFYMLLPAG